MHSCQFAQSQNGFNIIELMMVVAIVGILAIAAIPTYQDYTYRAKITDVINVADSARTGVSECLITNLDARKCNQNNTAGLDSNPANTNSQYVSNVLIGGGTAIASPVTITVTINNTGNAILDGGQMLWTGQLSNNGVIWSCTPSSTQIAKFMPANCRS
jgi:type IV pilus assembly protein PilA